MVIWVFVLEVRSEGVLQSRFALVASLRSYRAVLQSSRFALVLQYWVKEVMSDEWMWFVILVMLSLSKYRLGICWLEVMRDEWWEMRDEGCVFECWVRSEEWRVKRCFDKLSMTNWKNKNQSHWAEPVLSWAEVSKCWTKSLRLRQGPDRKTARQERSDPRPHDKKERSETA